MAGEAHAIPLSPAASTCTATALRRRQRLQAQLRVWHQVLMWLVQWAKSGGGLVVAQVR